MRRRTLLAASAVALTGCLDSFTGESELREHEFYSARERLADTGDAMYTSEQEARGAVVDDATEFVEDTDFDDSVLVYVEARAPQACYDIELADVTSTGRVLEANFEVVRGADDEDACADVVTDVSGLLRASFAGPRPLSAHGVVVDEDGEEREWNV
ncbi:MAG: hypothetical protein ACOCT0_01785 [Halobacteriota archaeon]